MITTVTLPNSELLVSASFFVNANDVRAWLRGVHLEVLPTEVIMVATTGEVMFIGRNDYSWSDEEFSTAKFTIPLPLLKGIKPKDSVTVVYNSSSDMVILEQKALGKSMSGLALSGEYANWRSVLPKRFSGEKAQYDIKILEPAQKAMKVLGPNRPLVITQNGMGPGYISLGRDDCFGLVMSLREAELVTEPPEWALRRI